MVLVIKKKDQVEKQIINIKNIKKQIFYNLWKIKKIKIQKWINYIIIKILILIDKKIQKKDFILKKIHLLIF